MTLRLIALTIACLLALLGTACNPPPAAWPIGGAAPQALGATSLEGYFGSHFNESGGSVFGAAGAVARYQASERFSFGAGLGALNGPFGFGRAYARLHVLDGHVAPTLGAGGASDFSRLDSGAVDLQIPIGLRTGAVELYAAPAAGFSFTIGGDRDQGDAIFVGGGVGASVALSADVSLGAEVLLSAVDALDLGDEWGWGGGAGAYLRYIAAPEPAPDREPRPTPRPPRRGLHYGR